MALLDEVKTALRVSINDSDINLQLESLIGAAKDDLTNTADIKSSAVEETPQSPLSPLVKLAIITYVKAYWTDDDNTRDKLIASYDSIKGRLLLSSAYSTYDEV